MTTSVPLFKAPIFKASLLALGIACANLSVAAQAQNWQPISSEKLMQMPSVYLDRAIQQDFNTSALADALQQANENIRLKGQSLKDTQDAIAMADGEARIDLQHQYLLTKSAYLDLMEEQQSLRREAAETRRKIYGDLMEKSQQDTARLDDPVRLELKQKQQQARQRLLDNMDAVDIALETTTGVATSSYASSYHTNMAKTKELQAAIRRHASNAAPQINGQEVAKVDYLRSLLQEAETELVLLDQEETMLGFMAQIVAMDAEALENAIASTEFAAGVEAPDSPTTLANAVDFFTN